MDLLILLVSQPAARSSRVQRSSKRLWGKDVFVDVETGVHTAIRKIRLALRDSPEAPTFVETVAGKGYRFVAPVEEVPAESPPAVDAPDAYQPDRYPLAVVAPARRARARRVRDRRRRWPAWAWRVAQHAADSR